MRETIVINERPENEVETINRMRCFGWELVGSQEIAAQNMVYTNANGNVQSMVTSRKHTKLTFQRDTEINNFNILDDLSRRFIVLLNEKSKMHAIVDEGGTAKSGVLAVLGTMGIGALVGMIYSFISEGEFDFGVFILPASICLAAGCAIMLPLMCSRTKKKYLPQIQELDNQMEDLARQARNYL